MSFAGFINPPPDWKTRLAQNLGAGVSQGMNQSSELAQQLMMKKFESQQKNKLLQDIRNRHAADSGMIPEMKEGEAVNMSQNRPEMTSDPFAEAEELSAAGFHDEARIALERAKSQQRSDIANRKEIREERKELKPEVDKIIHGYESAQISKASLDKMEQLEADDKLAGPWLSKLSDMTGIPISTLSNASTEEFEKVVAQRGLKVAEAYGFGRILQTEYENFLKTIPNLMNSPEGRKRIREGLRYFDNLAVKRYEIFKDIKKKSKGKLPLDLAEQVTERMESEFEKEREKYLSPSQSSKPSMSLEDIFNE